MKQRPKREMGERERELEGYLTAHMAGSKKRWMGREDMNKRRMVCISEPPEEPVTEGSPHGFLRTPGRG